MRGYLAITATGALNPIPRISRARRYGFSVITWMASICGTGGRVLLLCLSLANS